MKIHAPWKDRLAEPLRAEHLVQLYREEAALVEAVSLFAGFGLGKGDSVVLIATEEHQAAVRRRLHSLGLAAADLELWGQLAMIDAARLLDRVRPGGRLDAEAFASAIGDIVVRARAGGRYPRVRVYGEVVDLLWPSDHAAARRLEELWSGLVRAHGVSLLCAYRIDGDAGAETRFPHDLRALHSHLIPVHAGA